LNNIHFNLKACIKKLILISILHCPFPVIFSQESETFKPSGKVILRTFIEAGQGFGTEKNQSGFDISRAFLGYGYNFTPQWSATVIIDGASGNTDGKLEPCLRNAFVNYKNSGFELNVGMTKLYQFNIQENYWKHRYILKTIQDLNKMGNSADMGVTVAYKFNDYVSADVSLLNGEGYKKVIKNSATRFAGGVSVFPVKGFIVRGYADIYTESEDMRDKVPAGVTAVDFTNQKNLSLFAGYQDNTVSGGVEYAKMFDKGFIKGKNCDGISAFVSVKIAEKWRIFGRYDRMNSDKPANFIENWNSLDGDFAISGAEWQVIKQIKVAPNFRYAKNSAGKETFYLFVNFEFNL
jgi:hypothetical protein